MEGRNAMKQNLDLLINDKCSWSYKAKKIVKTSNTGNKESKIESTLTTIHVSQQRSNTSRSAPKTLRKSPRVKKQTQTKSKKVVQNSDSFLGLYEYGDMSESNKVSNKCTRVVPEKTPSSPCSSDSVNFLLSRDVAQVDECNDSAENESLPDLLHDESSSLVVPKSKLNDKLLEFNNSDKGSLKKDMFHLSPFGANVKAEKLLKESERNLNFENKHSSEKNDEDKKSSSMAALGDRDILPYEKNNVTTISSLYEGSPSLNGGIESMCNDTGSNRSSDGKEDESESSNMNEDLTFECSAQQRKQSIIEKTLTFADEVRGVFEELKSSCIDEEIAEDLMSGNFSIKKYQDREQELKASPIVPCYPKAHEKKAVSNVDLFSNGQEMLASLEYENNAQIASFNKNSENHLFQRETNVPQKKNETNSEKVLRAYEVLQNDLHVTESDYNTNDSSLCLNVFPSNLKTNDESKNKNEGGIVKKHTNTRKLYQNNQDADEINFPDASPLGLNLTKCSLEKNPGQNKFDLVPSHENIDQMLYSTNEVQATTSSGKLFYSAQNLNNKFLLKGQSIEPLENEHELKIFGNKNKNEYEEMNGYSYKSVNSTSSRDLFFDKQEKESKNINVLPNDFEKDCLSFTTKVESGAFNSVLKQAGFKRTVSAKKIFKEVKKSAIETRRINSVSKMKEIDCDIDEDLFIENTNSTNAIEESPTREDTESSNNVDALYEVGVPHSTEISSLQKSKENPLFVPVNEKFPIESSRYDKIFIKSQETVRNTNASIASLDSERSSVKYNLRKKRTEVEPKHHQTVPQKTAPSNASNKKAPNKRNVGKNKQNTQLKKGQAKQKKNTNSSFVTSSPLVTPIKRRNDHESGLQTIERQKKPKTWDDLEKEIQQDRHEREVAASLHGMVSRDNTCFTAVSREEKSVSRSGKTVKSAHHFSGYACYSGGGSGKTSDMELDKFSLFQARAEKEAPNKIQPYGSQAIVERTLAAMEKCKLNYLKQVEASEDNFEDGTSLKSNSTHERSLQSEDQISNNYPSINTASPEENFVPLYLTRSTKFSYANSTTITRKKNTTNTLCSIDNTDRREHNMSAKISRKFCLEDSGFQESFIDNNVKPIRNDVESEPENPWEKLQKRMQLCEWKVDQLYEEKVNLCDKRPIVHYLKIASSTSEKNISNSAAKKAQSNSIENTSANSVSNQRQKKNKKAPTLNLEMKGKRNEIYSNRVYSEEYHNDVTLFEEDASKMKFNLSPEADLKKSENLEDDDQMMMNDDDYQSGYCTTLKAPSRIIPNTECHSNETALLRKTDEGNVNCNGIEDISSCESEGKQSLDGAAIHSKMSNSSKSENEEVPYKNLNKVRQVKLEPKQRKGAIRGKESTESVTEGVGRRRQYRKSQKRPSKDDAFCDLLHSSESKQVSSNKTVNTYNTRRKHIPTIVVSSDSEDDNQKEDVATQRNAKPKQSKEKYKLYVGKLLQQNSLTNGVSQRDVTEEGLFKDRFLLAQGTDDLISISSSDSDTNLKGVGLLCDILGEEE